MHLTNQPVSSLNSSNNSSVNFTINSFLDEESNADKSQSSSRVVSIDTNEEPTSTQKVVKTIFSGVLIFLVVNIAVEGARLLASVASSGTNISYNEEAKIIVSSINKNQQDLYTEKGAFSKSINDLGVGLKNQTTNFKYSTHATGNAVFSYAIPRDNAHEKPSFELFQPNKSSDQKLRSYVGGVFLVPATKNEMKTVAITCEAKTPGITQPQEPTLKNGVPTCGANTRELHKL